ncbi:aminopeptidase O isoform X1 [Arapaima gigas]
MHMRTIFFKLYELFQLSWKSPGPDMETYLKLDSNPDLDPSRDDLPLKANTNHMLVRHYVLDLTVHFESKVFEGSIFLVLEARKGPGEFCEAGSGTATKSHHILVKDLGAPQYPSDASDTACGGSDTRLTSDISGRHGDGFTEASWESESRGDFVLVLDCCDLVVTQVEEVDVTLVPGIQAMLGEDEKGVKSTCPSTPLLQQLISLPAACWEQQHRLYRHCSQAPAPSGGGDLLYRIDKWSLQIRKKGVRSPHNFPCGLRIWYKTKPEGTSVRWTRDQSGRCCVYTIGSPINNRALFPCQEPPVAMSTWQARVQAPSDCVVLLSGESEVHPVQQENGFSSWDYYVTMPMPASTFTIAVGHWVEAKVKPVLGKQSKADSEQGSLSEMKQSSTEGAAEDPPSRAVRQNLRCETGHLSMSGAVSRECSKTHYSHLNLHPCSHMDYPCRFHSVAAQAQAVIPYRVFAPSCLLLRAEDMLLPLLSPCLAAAHYFLGVHPFARLDVLIVPAEFPSLGMASPHMIFLSQSVLTGGSSLCGARLCHEVAHSWFGLAIGPRDWTEEWISEGFATFLEDIFWAYAQQLSWVHTEEQCQLKALLRWRRLRDELQNSEEELQILRPNKESTGQVSESGASLVKHALNPEKTFMQVHYLKGYFLLSFLSKKVGEEQFLKFIRRFVEKYHGQLVLSQDFLQMFLECFPEIERQGLTLEAIYADWMDKPGIPEPLLHRSTTWLRTAPAEEVTQEVAKWIHFSRKHRKGSKRKRTRPKVNFKEMTAEQLVLLLELLLDEAELSGTALRMLERIYCPQERDAEVRHRWCELVVKHKHTAAYKDVERFLLEDQAMGVYLYGELMLHEDGRQQALARRCFSLARDNMDLAVRRVVQDMIY